MPEPAWPDGVIARYLTVGTATVDVRRTPDSEHRYDCLGCGDFWVFPDEGAIRRHGEKHAGECRAMPRPTEA